jgi:N-ethylmaleimide reductase
VSEGVQPSLVGQSNPGTPGLHTDEQVASWRPVTAAVHANGGRIFAQLMHGGRVSHPETTGTRPVGPSAVPAVGDVFTPTGPHPAPTPRALATAEVPEHARSYAEAVRRAIDAGFDGVELHGANGYLISQFLSSNANLRTDRYGGSVANRIRSDGPRPTTGSAWEPTSSASAAPSSPTPIWSNACAPDSRSPPSTTPPTTRAATRAT